MEVVIIFRGRYIPQKGVGSVFRLIIIGIVIGIVVTLLMRRRQPPPMIEEIEPLERSGEPPHHLRAGDEIQSKRGE